MVDHNDFFDKLRLNVEGAASMKEEEKKEDGGFVRYALDGNKTV